MNQPSYRVFFAVDLSPDTKMKLLSYQEKFIDLEAQPIDPANFHITLSFLGELNERKIETIMDNLSPIKQNSFNVILKEPVYLSSSKILALEVEDKSKQLKKLKETIESDIRSVTHLNIEKRDYLPHVSLFRKVETFPEFTLPIHNEIQVDSFCLMASLPTKNSVRYEIIEDWKLSSGSSIKEQLIGKS